MKKEIEALTPAEVRKQAAIASTTNRAAEYLRNAASYLDDAADNDDSVAANNAAHYAELAEIELSHLAKLLF